MRQLPHHNPADITGVIGASTTGKGLYVKRRISSSLPRRPGLTLVWSPLEATDRYAALLAAPRVTTLTGLIGQVRATHGAALAVVYAADLDSAHLEEEFAVFCQLAYRRAARVVVEELSYVTTASHAPRPWSKLTTAGSHHQAIEILATAQRPTMIDKNFLGSCSQVRCYRLVFEDDAVRMGKILRVPADELMVLPNRKYFHRWIHEVRTEQGTEPLPGARAIAPKVTAHQVAGEISPKVTRARARGDLLR